VQLSLKYSSKIQPKENGKIVWLWSGV